MANVPSDDLAARGRAIFERLRAAADEDPSDDGDGGTVDRPGGEDVPMESPPTEDAVTDEPAAPAATAVETLDDDGVPPPGPPPSPTAGTTPGTTTGTTSTDVDARPSGSDATADDAAAGAAGAPPDDGTLDDVPEPPKRPLPRVVAVANQKGGVGKTTTSINLGACLAELGHRTLVIDLDPQGNASTGLGINIRALESSMYDVILHDVPLEDCIEAASVRNLFVAPASLDLAGAEIELVPAFSRELRLKHAIDAVRDDYDFVLIDCPPSLGLLTVNGFAAADEVLVPIQCEYYALEGLGQLLRNVQLVQKNLNASLDVSTIVLVMYDARTKLADQVVREVRSHFGEKVCRTVIPRTVRLSEAPSFGQPIVAFDASSRGAIAYRELAKEVSRASERVG
jgi:chromosome partitioning protein